MAAEKTPQKKKNPSDFHTRCPLSYSAILSISSFIFSMFCRLFSSHSCQEVCDIRVIIEQDVSVTTVLTILENDCIVHVTKSSTRR